MVKIRKTGLSSNKSRPSKSTGKANAAGYSKRHSRKLKTPNGINDLYEYHPEKVRRSKIALEVGKDEAAELGRGSGGDSELEEPKARLVGEHGDDERVDSGDDEEIDSDAAFEESDEERFAGFNFSHKSNNKKFVKKRKHIAPKGVCFADVDLDEDGDMDDNPAHLQSANIEEEDEEMEEEGPDDEFIDVLDILDGKGEADEESETHGARGSFREEGRNEDDGSEAEDEEDEDETGDKDDEDDAHSDLSISDTEDAPEALAELEKFISNLKPGTKRKSPADTTDNDTHADTRPRKRRIIEERTEAGAENEFHAQAFGPKLDLNDLLAPLTSQSSNLLSLKSSTKVLAPSSSTKPLAAPLPQRTQERFDREAAYEQTKGEVDKWTATMKHIKEAEHLSFPLQAQPAGRPSNSELAAKFKPTTELESSVDKLLKSAKMREEDIPQIEELKMNHLSVEEVAARRGELREMRELMFRAEVKAKRVAKIKSKTYRRIKKKERMKLAEKLNEQVDEEDESVRVKRERDRALERATLRHKHTGKWAKAMKGRGELDIDQRREISTMLERGELLRKKIRGDRRSDEDDEDDDSDENEDTQGDVSSIKASAFEELVRLNMGTVPPPESDGKGKSIFDMKFMKDAMAREQQRVDEMVDDFVKEIGSGQNEGSETEAVDDERETGCSGIVVERTGGRVAYHHRTAIKPTVILPKGSLASDTSSVTLRSTDLPLTSPVSLNEPPSSLTTVDESNPWLAHDIVSKAPRKKNEVVVSKDSKSIEKSKNKLKKQARKRDEEKNNAREDAAVEISMTNVMTLGGARDSPPRSTQKNGVAHENDKPQHPTDSADDSDANSEVEEQEKAHHMKAKGQAKNLRAFEQRDLVALAFAGDNVVQDFQDAKRREIAQDAPREVDTTLPGWGAWGGLGTRRQAPKPHLIKKIAGVDPKSRADFDKSHVIISEKRDKKAAKYLVKDLPYPYTSQAQFERSLERPLGTEWNTRLGFQRGTLPRVVKKMGTIIDPLEKLF